MTENTERPRDSAAANALNALDADDLEVLLREAAQDGDVAAEIDGFARTAARLADAAPDAAPPARLRASVLDAIAGMPQAQAPERVGEASSPAGAAPAPVTETERATQPEPDRPSPVKPMSSTGAASSSPGRASARAARRWRGVGGAVAAVAGLAASVVVAASLGTVGSGGLTLADAAERARLVSSPGTQSATVAGTDGHATLVWSPETGETALDAAGLDALPDGSVYELWFIGADGPVSAGTFTPGDERTWATLDGTLTAGDVVGVTVEPDGGSPQPTTDPILVFET